MSHLRWNPLLRTYTMVAANRQNRPHMPKNWCPFCPGSGKVPDNYDVHVYPNDYPVLSASPNVTQVMHHAAYQNAPAYGHCEVVLYSPQHEANLYDLSLAHVTKLVKLWCDRTAALQEDSQVKYVYPFENRGKEVGVTMPHPHGQIYAYPFIPLKIKTELDSCKAYYAEHGRALFADIIAEELKTGERVLAQNDQFIAFLPYFTDYPFGVFIATKQLRNSLAQFNHSDQRALADILIKVLGAFDQIYEQRFPYMMCIHQSPCNSPQYADSEAYYHFHIEFYPPLRDKNKIKWYASSEMGAWAAANVVTVENSIHLLRQALEKFEQMQMSK